ncbi:MAG: carboxypeptidase regulatory-like domain-containing protein, partial [Flavobacteriales bacterium]
MNLIGKVTISSFLLLFFLGNVSFSTAQDKKEGTATLKGKVTNKKSGKALVGASVMLVGTYKGEASDIDGNYNIQNVKAGDYKVKASYVGFNEKVYNGVTLKEGETKTLNIQLTKRSETLDEVEVVGEKSMVDLESAKSKAKVSQEEIKEMSVKDVQEITTMQAGVDKTPDGLQIRGGRVYETTYLVEGVSAQDPLAGTGFGVDVSSSSVKSFELTTGASGADVAGGTSGVISTEIREGGEKIEIAGSWKRDNFGFNKNQGTSWNTDNFDFTIAGPVPFTDKKLRFFNNINGFLSDDYFGYQADQLHSSLFQNN